MPLVQSKGTIDYTQTLTFFPNTMTSTLVLFFTGHKIISTFSDNSTHLNNKPHLPTLPFIYNYSILSTKSTTLSKVTPCSIAACKSISNAPTTNKGYRVLFDSGSSKTLVHKCIVPWNFTPLSSTNDLWIFLLAGATMSMALVALEKIRGPEFNYNIVIDNNPALIVDSTNLQYDIIFGAEFLDKCIITIDYNSNQVCWME